MAWLMAVTPDLVGWSMSFWRSCLVVPAGKVMCLSFISLFWMHCFMNVAMSMMVVCFLFLTHFVSSLFAVVMVLRSGIWLGASILWTE